MTDFVTEFHTHTRNADAMRLAILVVYSLGAFTLAAELHFSWLGRRRYRVLSVYCGVLCFCVGWGLLNLGLPEVSRLSPVGLLLSLPLGLTVGVVATRLDRQVLRVFHRRQLRRAHDLRRGAARQVPRATATKVQFVDAMRSLGPNHRPMRDNPSSRMAASAPFLRGEFTTTLAVAVAVLEELLHRGLLVQLAMLAPTMLTRTAGLLALLAAFSLSHMWFGWAHVVSKLPLGGLCLLAVLFTGQVTPAVLAHVYFNLAVLRDMRSGAYTAPERGQVSVRPAS